MSKVQLQGNASGTGIFTIASPNSNTDRTLTLPDNTGTLLTSGSAIQKSQLPTGSVLQVVQFQAPSERTNTTSSSFVDTGLSATITPTSSSSKILIIVQHTGLARSNGGNGYINMVLLRNSTTIATLESQAGYVAFNSNGEISIGGTGTNVLDTPATTSAITYKTQFRNGGDVGQQVFIERQAGIILMEIAA